MLLCCFAFLILRYFTYLLIIKTKTLSSILREAYDEKPDSPPNIFVVSESGLLTDPENAQPSHPPISDLSDYPFLSRSVQDLADLLEKSDPEPAISSHQFLVADEKTNEDSTLIFVDIGYEKNARPETVRLDATHANAVPIAVQVATMDLNGIRSLLDEDGVYRGGPSGPEPKKGKPAPRKKLGA